MLPSAINRPACPSFGRPVSTVPATMNAPKPPSRPQARRRCVSISGSGAKPQRESRGQRPLVPAAQAASPARSARRTGATVCGGAAGAQLR